MSNEVITKEFLYGICKEKGFLAKSLFVVATRPSGDMATVMDNIEEHLKYQVALEKRGILFAAGPTFSRDGTCWEGEGMVVIRADSLEEAHRIAAEDPMHKSGAREFEIRPWLLNEGSVTMKVTYSDGKIDIS
ncbi:hypothetical protein HOP52_14355 [Halomonas campisalis]|uniref:YCII-related domain-containing protein n=1 Tax=Billgrantia campisalis TaxID=74661 RepID=A0ABS9PAX8_9GAMM|nr:YciI family protein [Halomonas campisalis]MCG6658939.1 hypothetical protein [Halomonas campisalis]MDR5863660.1 YciI family protein [Halomonas campisalis]